jgi:glyoxylase-like metal-dependent hydrolase (beta-lactamase superfamily II)
MSRPTIDRVEGTVMAVNSYLVHGPDGVIVVDGQLTVTDARAVRRRIDAVGKPVAALVVTHGHPDHYAGAAEMLAGLDVPIMATAAVDDVIRADDAIKDAIVGPMMGHEWPRQRRFPDQVVVSGQTLTLGGVELTVTDVGPAESRADSLWRLDEKTVFAGDVAYNGMHAYLADGRFAEWIAALTDLGTELRPDTELLVGHGPPTGVDALAAQRRYVEAFVEAVDGGRELDPDARHDAVVARMRQLLPTDDLAFLMELSIEPVLAGLR